MSIVGKETVNPFVEIALRSIRAAGPKDATFTARLRQSYRVVFNSPEGQEVLADILGQGGVFATASFLEASAKTKTEPLSVASGRRDLALYVLQQLFPEDLMAKRARKTK